MEGLKAGGLVPLALGPSKVRYFSLNGSLSRLQGSEVKLSTCVEARPYGNTDGGWRHVWHATMTNMQPPLPLLPGVDAGRVIDARHFQDFQDWHAVRGRTTPVVAFFETKKKDFNKPLGQWDTHSLKLMHSCSRTPSV